MPSREVGADTEAIEVKYGQTIGRQGYFTNLENYKALSKTPVKTTVVYGGQGIQQRGVFTLCGWREIYNNFCDSN